VVNKFTEDNKNNKDQESKDGLKQIHNAATILYMRKNNFSSKKRVCPLEGLDINLITYKNLKLLEQFVSERGKILPSRITGVTAQKQRALKIAIKRARVLALLPFENL